MSRGLRDLLASVVVLGALAVVVASPAQSVSPTAHPVTYHGGPTVHRAHVVGVKWGSGAYLPQVVASQAPNVKNFVSTLVQSPWLDLLSEYSARHDGIDETIHRGSFDGLFGINPAAANNTSGPCATDAIDSDEVRAELTAQLDGGALPPADPDHVYVVFFHQGQCLTAGTNPQTHQPITSLTDFCAYHAALSYHGARIPYVVMPYDANDAGCGPTPGFANFSSVLSHEIAESITDPTVSPAWLDDEGHEIGDLCNHNNAKLAGLDHKTYTVQNVWSQAQGKCAASGPPRFVSVGAALIVEGDSGERNLQVPITLSAPTKTRVDVTWHLEPVTASPADVVDPDTSHVVTWNPVSKSSDRTTVTKYVLIPIVGDHAVEGDETFRFVIEPSVGFGTGQDAATVTIRDDDPPAVAPAISIGDGAATVNAVADATIAFPITLSSPMATTATVHYAVTPGTAKAGKYVVKAAGTITIPRGLVTQVLVVKVRHQTAAPSANTTFRVTLSVPTAATLGRAAGTATLLAR